MDVSKYLGAAFLKLDDVKVNGPMRLVITDIEDGKYDRANLSFDDGGLARSAILTGAEFLPGLARCVQDMASGLRVGKAQMEGSGGVAEVTLGFREP